MASCIVQAVGNYRRAVAPQSESIQAQLRQGPRVDTSGIAGAPVDPPPVGSPPEN
jgi:hypothetical protein